MTRVLLADDHGIFLAGLRRLLEHQEDLDVVGVAADGREAGRLLRLDRQLPGGRLDNHERSSSAAPVGIPPGPSPFS